MRGCFAAVAVGAGGKLAAPGLAAAVGPRAATTAFPDLLLADLQAQVAANQLGLQQLEGLMAPWCGAVQRYMGFVQSNAAAAVRRVLQTLEDRQFHVELDNGARLQVAISVDRLAVAPGLISAVPQSGQPQLSCAPAVTKAAVLYAFRALVPEPIPLNAGCFEPWIWWFLPGAC